MVGWTTGSEREVAPGCYAKLVENVGGWTLWRFETANGVFWSAAKSAIGTAEVTPLGVGQVLWGGVPRIHLHFMKNRPVSAFLHGSHFHEVRAEMRRVGERFTKTVPAAFDPRPYDGDQLEVFIQSMPGPKSFTKVAKERGVIDMTDCNAIIEIGNAGAAGGRVEPI